MIENILSYLIEIFSTLVTSPPEKTGSKLFLNILVSVKRTHQSDILKSGMRILYIGKIPNIQ